MQITGIDVGTTTVSIVLLDADSGGMIARETVAHNAFLPDSARCQDPDRIWNIIKEKLDGLAGRYGKTDCIGLTGQMHGMLYVDRDGNAVSPLYTWQDESGNERMEDGLTCAQRLNEAAGPAYPGYGITTHFYLQKQNRIPEEAAKMTTISDYIAMKLCANTEPVIGVDMAASWGCFDLERGGFRTGELKNAGVDISYLPEIAESCTIIGETPDHIPVMNALGDNQASVLGSVRDLHDTVLLNVGTGSQISVVTKRLIPCSGNVELRPCAGNNYIAVGAGLCGGRAYAMLENFYREVCGDGEPLFYDRMMEHSRKFLAEHDRKDAWNIHTTFSGTREDPEKKGSIEGISVDNFHPGAFTVGMIEGILEELLEMYEQMRRWIGKKATRLVGSGNGLRQNRLMQRMAEEMFEMKMDIPACQEEAACGAALCSLVAAGKVASLEDIREKISYVE